MFDGINLQCGFYFLNLFLVLYFKNTSHLLPIFVLLGLIYFLYLNYKNKLFLGDTGNYLLSFLSASLLIKSHNLFIFDIKFYSDEIFMYMILPFIDMIRVIYVRIINGKSPFDGDRNHLHHLIVSSFDNRGQLYMLILIKNTK